MLVLCASHSVDKLPNAELIDRCIQAAPHRLCVIPLAERVTLVLAIHRTYLNNLVLQDDGSDISRS
jgi:hypothetical protein